MVLDTLARLVEAVGPAHGGATEDGSLWLAWNFDLGVLIPIAIYERRGNHSKNYRALWIGTVQNRGRDRFHIRK